MEPSTEAIFVHGKLELPLPVQQALGLREGSRFTLTLADGKLILEPRRHNPVQAMQELFNDADYSLGDDLKEFRASKW